MNFLSKLWYGFNPPQTTFTIRTLEPPPPELSKRDLLNALYDIRGDIIVEKILANFWREDKRKERLASIIDDLNIVIHTVEKLHASEQMRTPR